MGRRDHRARDQQPAAHARREALATAARDQLAELLAAGDARVCVHEKRDGTARETFGRLVADLEVDRQDVGESLVEEVLAGSGRTEGWEGPAP